MEELNIEEVKYTILTPDMVLRDEFGKTFELFDKEIFAEEYSLMCKIHDAFGGNESQHHNCLGCNFASSTTLIRNFLSKYESYTDINDTMTLYILTLYLLVERMEVVFELITVPINYKNKYFKVFEQIRKWANFIKHPKAFVLVHHPIFEISENLVYDHPKGSLIIDDAFIATYYTGKKDFDAQKKSNKELLDKLKNKKDVVVLFPSVFQITTKLCFSINKFVELITKNEVFIEVLNDDTTIDDYFVNRKEE